MGDIAVVGIDCAFPGAAGVRAYWDLLVGGRAGIGPVPGQRWEARDFPAVGDSGGFIDDADVFDSDFFSVTPREAAAMDPHQRLLLPCAWRALEDAGRAPGGLAGSGTGVFVGVMGGEWGRLTMSDLARVTPLLGSGSSAGMAANRISYHFDFTGPSLAVDTACSSSLVAVHLAANSLLAGECDTALAGGVNIVLSPSLGLVYGQLGLAAADGRCKPFSAEADGIGRSDGVGLVVLRRLEDALADGDRVYAVLRGSAVNQDGRSNGMIAPNRWSQERVLNAAYKRAGVSPAEVAFVEAHGTGTVLGDAIECAALGSVHGVPRETPCAIGSVKGNLGHTEAAAGIAGFIKAALALHHRIVPASLYAERENSRLRLGERGLRLLKSPARLPRGENIAGVSSFGMGGTNAHAVLASAPRSPRAVPARARADAGAAGVFTVSADTPEALCRNLAAQADALAALPKGGAAALCRSSNRVKTGLPHRFALTARSTGELVDGLRRAVALRTPAPGELRAAADRPWGRPVVAFLFTGQGSEYPAMTAGLYRESPAYRRHFDAADEALAVHLGTSVREAVLGGEEWGGRPELVQPALFAVGYALARTLTELGVTPAAVLGHSLGEYAAAVTAGVLPLDGAAALVARRARLTAALPPGGGMITVAAGPETLAPALAAEPEVVAAALNGPADTVLSGPLDALARIAEELTGLGIRTRELASPYAFHSARTAPVAAGLRTAPVDCAPAALPVASTRYGRMLRDEPMDAEYWAGQAEEPVLFDAALGALVRDIAPTHLVEIGPQPQLTRIAARAGSLGGAELLHPAPGPEGTGRDLAETVAALYRCGLDPDWEQLYAPEHRSPEPLVPYVFSSAQRYWDRPPASVGAPAERRPEDPPRTENAPRTENPPRPEETPRPEDPPRPVVSRETESDGAGSDDPVLVAVVEAVTEVGGYPTERVVREARFHEDLGFDSVMIMQLKNRVEARLPRVGEVSVQQMLPALRSVGSLAEFLDGVIMARSA
ncbi:MULTISPECIES: beta-ketoacyl synthase N-terminal-like domain-containing protein [unclassified Streptomyces]|uniref:type I polyketide synthase n=1 Tax=unclassified Streptomyces TaxID=2593676 RepID=UPI002ED10305|nr:acyltransferase domain-containing protein [Streptomyces sp. NBC_00891]WSY06629.1 acyltransferase domain-containing protein [Streptomyces sp. NBC_00890]WSZ08253.1 acyltransferase domain-containing protein [Streptomyces sp. NBC_00869]WSZ24248.1 acyltransferase domain-containing protein [Streptomyces sp. NBC_00870]